MGGSSIRSCAVRWTVLCAFALAFACKREEEPRPPTEGEPARRAAQSFVHCVETGGAGCIDSGLALGGWDGFSILGWLATGSPISILQALPRELAHHRDPRSVQRRFVDQVERHRDKLRGAECRPERVDPLDPMVPKLSQAAQTRLRAMGLWSGDLQGVVEGLGSEAGRGLAGGYLVSMRCLGDPWELYVATTTQQDRHVVVGMLTVLPEFLGGAAPSRDATTGRLRSITIQDTDQMSLVREGDVDPWLAIPVEEF
jgi:hypothetical protein